MIRIADEGESDLGWECLRCTQAVKSAGRYVVEVQVGSEFSGSDYDFSSDVDSLGVTDLSASVGTWGSESEISDD